MRRRPVPDCTPELLRALFDYLDKKPHARITDIARKFRIDEEDLRAAAIIYQSKTGSKMSVEQTAFQVECILGAIGDP